MKVSLVEELFHILDETATILQKEEQFTYLDGIAATSENIFQEALLQQNLSEVSKKKLLKKYEKVQLAKYTNEQIRKAFQLATLKGLKGSSQPNHQMTPDSIGLIISYLIGKFMKNEQTFSLLDPAVGTGNLLMTILNNQSDKNIHAFGVDVDDLFIQLAYSSANLQQHEIQFFQQDALEPMLIKGLDVIACDLPIGYYPNDENAKNYTLRREKGHSFAHYLFIEQSIFHTKPGGYLFFLIPNHLFVSEDSDKLHAFLKEHVFIQGLIQLPLTLFKNKEAAKSIFILQKKEEGQTPPKEVLLANLPDLKNPKAMGNILQKIDIWFKENK